jgi:DNA-binding beta-propeller fold protein YncE
MKTCSGKKQNWPAALVAAAGGLIAVVNATCAQPLRSDRVKSKALSKAGRRISAVGAVLSALAILLGLCGTATLARDRVYVLVSPLEFDYNTGPSAVVAFDVDAQGLLTQRESYETGGDGLCGESGQELVIHPSGRFLLAPNNRSGTVSVFNIATNGTLSLVPGSPFVAGNGPMALGAHPNGQQVYVTAWRDEAIQTLSIDSLGVLSGTQVLATYSAPRELKVDPLGRCLYVADMGPGLRAYNLAAPDGPLAEIPGSPFGGFNVSRPYCVQVASDGSRVFLLDLDSGVTAYNLASDGTPAVAGAAAVGDYAAQLKLMPDDRTIYVGLPFANAIRCYGTSLTGQLVEVAGSPFTTDPDITNSFAGIAGFACSRDGSRLYAATTASGSLQAFAVAADGNLSRLGSLHVMDPAGRTPNGIAYCSNSAANTSPIAVATVSPLFAISLMERNPVVLSRDNMSAEIVLNGSGSSDPDGDVLNFIWYETGNILATGLTARTVLPVGTHAIQLAVSDGMLSATNSFTIEVITTVRAVSLLVSIVESQVTKPHPLLATLTAALASIQRGNSIAAMNHLRAFQNQLQAQVAPLDPALAAELSQSAQQIAVALGAQKGA